MNERAVVALAMAIPGATFPQEVAYLYRLACEAPVGCEFVELGTYQGRTLTALAAASVKRNAWVVSIDDYSYPEQCSIETTRLNLEATGLMDKGGVLLDLIEGDSRERPVTTTQVGLLFVDSCHTRVHFDAEMAAWLGAVVVGGIVACHDYDSPTWLEMNDAIRHWLFTPQYELLGHERRTIAFRKVSA